MSATQQKRWLTQPNSKLAKADLSTVLRKEDAWLLLSPQTKQELYALLPSPQQGEPPHAIDVHPFQSQYKPFIEEELRRWQQDLSDGKETKKWREDAMRSGKDRAEGKWDEWKEQARQTDWVRHDENSDPREEKAEVGDAKEAKQSIEE